MSEPIDERQLIDAGRRVIGIESAAIAEVPPLAPQGEAVTGGTELVPIGQGRQWQAARVEVHQPPVQQPVDPGRGGIGGKTRVQVDGCAGQPDAQGIGRRVAAGTEEQRQRQQQPAKGAALVRHGLCAGAGIDARAPSYHWL